MWRAGLVLALTLPALSRAQASAPADSTGAEQAAEKHTNPFALANTLQVQPGYTDIYAGGNSTQLLVRLAVAYKALFIPGIKVADVYSFVRLEMYGEALNTPQSPNAIGLQDWKLLVGGVKPFAWGALVGVGFDALLPTVTNLAFDKRELELGPATAFLITHVPHLQIGALVQFFFSVAGATSDLAYVLVQPIIAYHLPRAFFFKTDGIMNLDLEHSPHATVPVNLHFGRGITSHVVLSGIVEVVTVGSGKNDVTVQLNVNYLSW